MGITIVLGYPFQDETKNKREGSFWGQRRAGVVRVALSGIPLAHVFIFFFSHKDCLANGMVERRKYTNRGVAQRTP